MQISDEKKMILALSDEEVKKLLKLARTHAVQQKARKSPRANEAYRKLQGMVGMESLKETLENMLNYHYLQETAASRGHHIEDIAFHCAMKGSPGTGKTSGARMLAQILKDNGICSKAVCKVCTRADLIAEHVGGTAPKVRKAFEEALGGVLLIDEAYSLLDDDRHSYGTEAINTIIELLETYRGEIVVLFAGYEEEMTDFLKSNPGLSSRIQFSVDFTDYTLPQLIEITRYIATEKGFRCAEDSDARLEEIFTNAMKQQNFGNARYARKLVEQAIMAKARKIRGLDAAKMSDEELFSLSAEDFTELAAVIPEKRSQVAPIGFTA